VTAQPFESFAQNGEDVVLARALRSVPVGHYVEVGANHPTLHSISRAFYDRGWRGITIEPVHEFAEMHRAERPRDHLVEAAVTTSPDDTVTLHQFDDTGLSTLVDEISTRHEQGGRTAKDVAVPARTLDEILGEVGWGQTDIHFMTVDTEGAELEVLRAIDLTVFRPWILVIESTAPETADPTHGPWEQVVLSADYRFCLFDGLSRFYVASERAPELTRHLSYPACVLDDYTTQPYRTLRTEREEAISQLQEAREGLRQTTADLLRWRDAALSAWADAAVATQGQSNELERLRTEIEAIHETVSWRVTKPLRAVREHMGTPPNGR